MKDSRSRHNHMPGSFHSKKKQRMPERNIGAKGVLRPMFANISWGILLVFLQFGIVWN